MTNPAFGQLTIFDIPEDAHKRKPCEYSFKRYVGQRVRLNITEGIVSGTIVEIEKYYTIVKANGRLLVGTPTNTSPEKED